MDSGRLIRVTNNHRRQPSSAHITPVQDSSAAIAVIRDTVGADAEIEDLGSVSELLPRSLLLHPAIQKLGTQAEQWPAAGLISSNDEAAIEAGRKVTKWIPSRS